VIPILLLLLPILVALGMGRLSVVIVSTVVWKCILSGFGAQSALRGYLQSRLDEAFGRPMRLVGIQCGAGLIITCFLFGLCHADHPHDPAIVVEPVHCFPRESKWYRGCTPGLLQASAGSMLCRLNEDVWQSRCETRTPALSVGIRRERGPGDPRWSLAEARRPYWLEGRR
jgi:hypothetical protein